MLGLKLTYVRENDLWLNGWIKIDMIFVIYIAWYWITRTPTQPHTNSSTTCRNRINPGVIHRMMIVEWRYLSTMLNLSYWFHINVWYIWFGHILPTLQFIYIQVVHVDYLQWEMLRSGHCSCPVKISVNIVNEGGNLIIGGPLDAPVIPIKLTTLRVSPYLVESQGNHRKITDLWSFLKAVSYFGAHF